MTGKRKRDLRGLVEPVWSGKPVVVRLCEIFVESLPLILRTLFVIAGVLLVRELGTLPERIQRTADDLPARSEERPPLVRNADAPVAPDPVINDRIRHALQCTYEAYRNLHFDECVDGPSSVYSRPRDDTDGSGRLQLDAEVLFAALGAPAYPRQPGN